MTQTTKNEKVVHTRVSNDLFKKILDKAKKNRVSTSNLIRNLVEDYIEIHNEVWEAVDKKVNTYLDSEDDLIVGYQPIVLNMDKKCNICGIDLKRGENAFIGVQDNSSKKIIVCQKCSGVIGKNVI